MSTAEFPTGGGAMGARVRAHDWSASPLGPIDQWPQCLKTIVDLVLAAALPTILLWRPEFIQIYNDAYAPIMGTKHPAGLGQPAAECWPEVWSLAAPLYERVFAGETVTLHDLRWTLLRNGSPEEVYLSTWLTPVRDEAGVVAGAHITVVETTEQMKAARERDRAEQALHESEARLRDVLDGIGEAFYVLDHHRRFLHASRRALEIWGKKPADLIGRTLVEAFPHAPGTPAYEAHERVLETGVTEHVEIVSPLLGRWVEVDIYPASTGLSVTFRDIDRRKRAEAALRESEERFRTLTNAVPAFIWFTEPDGKVTFSNEQWFAYTGITDEGPEIWPDVVFHPDERVPNVAGWRQGLQAGAPFEIEARIRRYDGEYRWFVTQAVPVRDAEDRITAWFSAAIDIHDRKIVEERLRESEEHLRLALEAGHMGTWEWDAAKGFLTADATHQALFGLPSQDQPLPIEVYWAYMVPEEIRWGVEKAKEALRNGMDIQLEQRIIRPDGEVRWMLTRGRAKDGNPACMIGVSYDITERVRAEQALRDSEARLLAILNQVPGGVGFFNREGRMLLRGGPLSALWDDVIPSGDPASVRRWRSFDASGGLLPPSQYPGARALRGETVSPGVDFLHTADDGRETWIRVSAAPFRDDAGKIGGTVAVLQNVDDEKRAEQRLRESEARLQAAVGLVKLGCYAWDPQTNELKWDETLKAMWGLPADAPVDYEVWRSCVHPDDLARVEAAIQRCVGPGSDGLYDIEYRVIGKTDGVERWIATRGRMHFANGRPASFFGIALDVTTRKRIESALERRIEERTRELAHVNRQLRSQIEQRETAEAEIQQMHRLDAIGQITSGVAHDFNNLLSVVLMNARLLARKARDPDDQEGIDLICVAAERGKKLTAQLLAFSRKQQLEPQVIDLNSKIMGMSDLLSVTLGGTVDLRTILAPYLWPALVDPTQFELIVLNLAINARDAMESGGTLTLKTFNATIESEPLRPEGPSPGDYVGLTVSDTGVGISNDVLPHVFEPFFTTKERGKGSGLGLAQVFGFAKQSGGGVRIETRIGEGTSMTVFLPRAEVAATDQERDLNVAEQGSRMRRKLGILVVDDDKMVLKSTLRVLASLGYAALAAESGEEALGLIANNLEIDLVLADFAMPEMNGVELAKSIQATRPALPIILTTGYSDVDILKEFGEWRILRKPYAEADLLEKIKDALY